MNSLDLLSTTFYEFKCEPTLVNKVLEEVENIKYQDNINNQQSIWDENYFNNELFEWFDSCIDKVKQIHFNYLLKFPITSCWVNKATINQSHFYHNHPNSVISGIFYLTTHISSKTIFFLDNPWHEKHKNGLLISGRGLRQNELELKTRSEIYPESGKLILFPSHIYHMVEALEQDETRYTISFNTFPQGTICKGPVASMLELQPKTVRDL